MNNLFLVDHFDQIGPEEKNILIRFFSSYFICAHEQQPCVQPTPFSQVIKKLILTNIIW